MKLQAQIWIQSSEQVESEHAVSIEFVVVSALVTLACPSEHTGWKKVVTRVDVTFVFSLESIL